MAAITLVPKIKRQGSGTSQFVQNTVYTKTLTIDTLSTMGATDVITVNNVFPAGTVLKNFYWKSSVTQATTTFAPAINAGTAFVTAVVLVDTAIVEPVLVPGTKSANIINSGTTDLPLTITMAVAAPVNATITMTFCFQVIDPAVATYGTFTI